MADGAEADSIKAAVRDAAKKTQDRLAAYREKQAAKAAAAAVAEKEKANRKPSKDALEAAETVKRLQGLVSQSKRLQTKSRELNAAPATTELVPSVADLVEAAMPATPKDNAFRNSSTGTTPKAKKLSEIMQNLNNDTENNNANTTSSKTPKSGKKSMGKSGSNHDLRKSGSNQELRRSSNHGKQSKNSDNGKKNYSAKQSKRNDDNSGDNGAGEFSIMSVIENSKPRPGAGIVDLPQEDIDDMIQEYYSTSDIGGGSAHQAPPDLDASLPLLEAILETPVPTKGKVGKRKPPSSSSGKKPAPMPAAGNNDEELDNSMPILAPFETPKVSRPKLQSSSRNETLNDDDSPSMSREEGEASLSLSQVMRNPDLDKKKEDRSSNGSSNQKSRRRGSNETPQTSGSATSRGSGKKLNLGKLPLMTDNAGSSRRSDDDDDNRSFSSAASSRSRRSRRGTNRESSSRGSSRSRSVSSRRKPNRRSSLNGERNKSPNRRNGAGTNVSLSIINKYHQKAEESLQSFPDDQSRDGSVQSNSIMSTNNNNNSLDKSPERNSSSEQLSGGSSNDGEEMGNSSSDASANSRRSTRRGRSGMGDRSLRRTASGMDGSYRRARSRSAVRRGAPAARSVSRSASARRGGPRRPGGGPAARRASMDGSGLQSMSYRTGNSSFRDVSSRSNAGPPLRRSRTRGDPNNGSMRDMSARRHRRSQSVRRSAGGRRRGSDPDMSEASTADEILGSLDPSDIKIVGVEDDALSTTNNSNNRRPSMRAPKRNSLAGLENLPSDHSPTPKTGDDDDEVSVTDSVKSKKSKMGMFARKVGRKLTMQKKKKKKDGSDDDSDDDDEDETEVDDELQALAAEYDKEDEEIEEIRRNSGPFEASFSKGDFEDSKLDASKLDDLADEPEEKKNKKKRGSTWGFGKLKRAVGVGGGKSKKKKKKKKKQKDLKGSEVLESDSDSDDDELELLGSESTHDRAQSSDSSSSDSESDDGDESFAQLQIDGNGASIAMCGSDRSVDEQVAPMQAKGPRQNRSAATMRRQRADRQRAQTLQAVLGGAPNGQRRGNDDDGSVMRTRRNRSMRNGRIPRLPSRGEDGSSKLPGDIKRHKSLKGRVEGGDLNNNDKSKKVRRTKSVEVPGSKPETDDDEPPPFDWEAYSAEKETKKGAPKERKKSKMSGGLSKIIYASNGQ